MLSRNKFAYKFIYIIMTYCRSGNVREVLIFANFARTTNPQIEESRENYFYNSATKKKKIREL